MATEKQLFERLDQMLVFRQGDQRAPHKPLYLLYCISELQKGSPRLRMFEDVGVVLGRALRAFGPRTETVHPEYPFWRLQNDGLAVVEADGPIQLRASNDDAKVSSLRAKNARGGLLEDDHKLLSKDFRLQSMLVHRILDAHFPGSIHEDIVKFFGLELDEPHARDKTSSRDFRDAVLTAYNGKCSLTGFDLRVGQSVVGVEAAHIFWPQSGGNDDVSNGIAMTTLHRKLFHLGLFSIREDFEIDICSDAREDGKSPYALSGLAGLKIRLPDKNAESPNKAALAWHRRWVFRG